MSVDILQFFYPTSCLGCRKPGVALCSRCLSKIKLANSLEEYHCAVFDYGDQIIQNAIRDFKYRKNSPTTKLLVKKAIPYIEDYLSQTLQNIHAEKIYLIPIPEHKNKLRRRGFNQSVILAKWLAQYWNDKQTQINVLNILQKDRETPSQASLGRNMRLTNIQNTMSCVNHLDEKLIYIIIDDVTTTGATFHEAKRALINAGAKKIFCIALAHGYVRK